MAFWDKVRSVATQASSQIKASTSELSLRLADEVKKYKNKDYLVAILTGCVYVAQADNGIQQNEKSAMSGFLSISEELKVFGAADVIATFDEAVKLFDFDPTLGRAEALKRIGKIKGNVGAAKTLVRVCINLANSDQDFSEKEKVAVRDIVTELGLNVTEFLPA